MGVFGTGKIWRGCGCSEASRIRRCPLALGDRLRAPWPLGRSPRRGGENDEDQSRYHAASVAAAILLPRPYNPRPLRPRPRSIGLVGDKLALIGPLLKRLHRKTASLDDVWYVTSRTTRLNVRYGSLADIGKPIRDVRFAPISGH